MVCLYPPSLARALFLSRLRSSDPVKPVSFSSPPLLSAAVQPVTSQLNCHERKINHFRMKKLTNGLNKQVTTAVGIYSCIRELVCKGNNSQSLIYVTLLYLFVIIDCIITQQKKTGNSFKFFKHDIRKISESKNTLILNAYTLLFKRFGFSMTTLLCSQTRGFIGVDRNRKCISHLSPLLFSPLSFFSFFLCFYPSCPSLPVLSSFP